MFSKHQKSSVDLETAKKVKLKVRSLLPKDLEICGIGITRKGEDYAVKINVSSRPRDPSSVPDRVEGVPIVLDIVAPIHKQAIK